MAAFSGTSYAVSTADHTRFKELQQDFKSGPEVTRACIKCHTEAAKQIHKTNHWTWEFLNPDNKQRLGKRNILNNFCITPQSNFAYCTACHIGYGWKDETFDFTSEESVDCLVCHDNSGTYQKKFRGAGVPDESVNLLKSARSVGMPRRRNCGGCHFP